MSWYRAGSIAVTNGSPAVTGTGTAWIANVQPGHAINLPDGRVYEIAGIVSDTQITLGSPYQGSTGSGQAYSVQPNQGFAQAAATALSTFLTQYAGYVTGSLSGRFGDGAVATPGITFAADQDTGFYRKYNNVTGYASGGVQTVEFGTSAAFYADPGGSVAADFIGRVVDNGVYLRLVDASRSTVLGSVAFDPAVGLALTANAGSARVTGASGAAVYFRIGTTDKLVLVGNGFLPSADNVISMGNGGQRFTTVYASTGSIQTSDERLKDWRGVLSAGDLAAAKEIASTIGIYQFKDAIADKGADARLHVGVKAQATIAIMQAHGLDPMRYAFVCYDAWDAVPATPGSPAVLARPEVRDDNGKMVSPADPGRPAIPGTEAVAAGDRYSIRYDELAMFIAAAWAQQEAAAEAKLASFEQRIAALEAA